MDAIAPADHLREIPEETPVTVFASEDDRYSRIEEVRSMVEAIRSHARLVSVREGGHGRFLTLHEAEYRRSILEAMAKVERGK
jgi:pimeloyl-ACP methyl ester carboxylesterase